jgi:hypothetical protein
MGSGPRSGHGALGPRAPLQQQRYEGDGLLGEPAADGLVRQPLDLGSRFGTIASLLTVASGDSFGGQPAKGAPLHPFRLVCPVPSPAAPQGLSARVVARLPASSRELAVSELIAVPPGEDAAADSHRAW